jgi:hypothetical protein
MIIKQEKDLNSFEFWSGAKDKAEQLTYEELKQITEELEALYPEGIDETELNDIFWFDFGYVCELIGLTYNEDNAKIERGEEDDE